MNIYKIMILIFMILNTQKVFAQTRIKDLVELRGVRSNQLMGFGLVIGLPGTGDSKSSLVTNDAVSQLLKRLGMPIESPQVITKNIAAVIVTANLPPFARIGDKIDIRISSVGDSVSLEGGTLLLTPLHGANDEIYAIAQGPISQGTMLTGAQIGGNNGVPPKTVALSWGATVEKEFEQTFVHQGRVELSLKNADFTTARRITQKINEKFGSFLARAKNSRLIEILIPTTALNNPSFSEVDFVSSLEQLEINPDMRAKIIINERTGTIIGGGNVKIENVAISHGNLQIKVNEISGFVGKVEKTTTIQDLVEALNSLGAGPKDLAAILRALDAANAIHADIEFL